MVRGALAGIQGVGSVVAMAGSGHGRITRGPGEIRAASRVWSEGQECGEKVWNKH